MLHFNLQLVYLCSSLLNTEHTNIRQFKILRYKTKKNYLFTDLENFPEKIYKFNVIINVCQYIFFQFFNYARAIHGK